MGVSGSPFAFLIKRDMYLVHFFEVVSCPQGDKKGNAEKVTRMLALPLDTTSSGRIGLIYVGLLSLNSVKPAKIANEGKL